MNYPTEDIVNALGYHLTIQEIIFSFTHQIEEEIINKLKNTYYQLLPKITINSEIAKREFIIAPLLSELILRIDAKLSIEYPIDVNEQLNGVIDYLIRSQQDLIVIEAKKGDLDRGFNQLAAEMIALDQYEENSHLDKLYGVLTIGEVWRFAILKRPEKTIIKDINLFRFPQDIKEILSIFLEILQE